MLKSVSLVHPLVNACRQGNVEMVNQFVLNYHDSIDYGSSDSISLLNNAFGQACCYGNLNIADLLLRKRDTYQFIDISTDYEYAFRMACENGHLEVAQWLLQVKPNIQVDALNEWAFRNACMMRHLKVAKWLLQVKPDIDISVKNEDAFRLACANGHLEVAKWLLQIKPNIQVDALNEWAFRMACANGHLEIAKLLHNWMLIITHNYVTAFRYACENGHLKVAEWLVKISHEDMWLYRRNFDKLTDSENLFEILESTKDGNGRYIINYEINSKYDDISLHYVLK